MSPKPASTPDDGQERLGGCLVLDVLHTGERGCRTFFFFFFTHCFNASHDVRCEDRSDFRGALS